MAYQLQARTIRETILKPANDVGPMVDFTARNLFARAMAVWFAAFIFGGVALAKAITFVAGLFRAPEFADHQQMGFLMAAVLGLCLATAFIVDTLRKSYAHG